MLQSGQNLRNPQFFVGVVEDRNDPVKMGRVRVRAFGVHTEDKALIPTDKLPWAMPIMPYTSASISGVGHSPTGPVEGTWVFGAFIDGQEQQQPVVFGTMVGFPTEQPDKAKGFADPDGNYPKVDNLEESDTNRLARNGGDEYSEPSLVAKIENRQTGITTAVPPQIPTIKENKADTYYVRREWSEPNPRYGGEDDAASERGDQSDDTGKHIGTTRKAGSSVYALKEKSQYSKYPYNHTWTTESGHTLEMDDTPDAERIHLYHSKGTFFEFQPDGTRVTKVVGDDYEIIAGDKKVAITGNTDVTFGALGKPSDVRIYVHKDANTGEGGDLYLEVDGNFNLNVKGDMVTKIQGNDEKVVLSDQATNVNGNRKERITLDKYLTVGGSHQEIIVKNHNHTITGNTTVNVGGMVGLGVTGSGGVGTYNYLRDLNVTATTNTQFSTGGSFTVGASANVNMTAEQSFKFVAVGGIFNLDTGTGIEMSTALGNFTANTMSGVMDLDAATLMYLDASTIHLNLPGPASAAEAPDGLVGT